jgi:hypothetical protein
MKFVIGLLLIAAGVATVMYTEWIVTNIGTNDWAEAKFGTFGGSRMLYKLMGLGAIFIGFVIMFGMSQGFLKAIFGRIIVQ